MKKSFTLFFVVVLCFYSKTTFSQYYPGGFSKSKINYWFDASDSATLTRDSSGIRGNVTTWKDKVNNLSATQSNSSNRPRFTTQNGKNIVEFNGTKGLDIASNALCAPQNGYNAAQVVYVYPDAPTTATDFRYSTLSNTNAGTQGYPQIGIRYLALGFNKYVVTACRNNTGYYYTSYNDLLGQWLIPGNYTPGNLPSNSSNAFSNYYHNGGGSLSSNGATTPPTTLTATIGNRTGFYNNVHWGVSETVLAGYDTKTSGKRILDLYLAAKWGMLDTLINSYGALYAPSNPVFNNNLVGIGIEGAGDTTNATGSNNGLGLQNINGVTGFLRKQGSYILAADNALTGNVTMAIGITRWNRAWYLNKTDPSNYGGLLNIFFDFTSYGQASALDTANNIYYLLYNPTNGYFNSDSNYLVQVNSYQQFAGTKQLAFLLDGVNLNNGYYTIVYAPKATSISALPNLATFIAASISVTPPPTIPSVYPGNTFNYVQIDSSSITYPVAYYKIYASINGGAITAIDSTNGTPTYYPHYNLINGNSYLYKVSAVYAPGKESGLSDSAIGIPNNNTPQWLILPQYSKSGSIFMAAAAPLSGLPLKFSFENVTGGGNSSGFQLSSQFTDSLLTDGNTYSYRYRYMDTVIGSASISGWSSTQSVLMTDSIQGGYTYNMTYLDPTTPFAPYGIGPANILPSNQDITGLRFIKHVPAVGQHPRIFCSPSDSTEIRSRLKNTSAGVAASRFIHAYTTLLQLGNSGYNRNTFYSRDTLGNVYFSNVGAIDTKALYDSLALGDIGVRNNYASLWGGNYAKMAYNFSHEAMECWIYRNQIDSVTNTSYTTRAKKLATALTVWAKKVVADNTIVPDLNMSNFGGLHNAIAYDFLYDQMTKNQQDTIRMAILKTLPDSSKEHGCWTPSYTTTTNWATFGGEITCNIAVEGEPGYTAKDSGLLRGWVKTVWNFLTYGIYSTGDMYEGIGKNRLNEFLLVAMAKRGFSVLGHPNIRAYAQKYLPAVVQPFGYSFIGTDILGGTGTGSPSTGGWKHTFMDIGGLKWAFPADSSVDFIWKNAMQRQFANQTGITNNYYAYNNTTCGDNYGAGFNTHVPGLLFASNYFSAPVTSYAKAALGNNKFYFDSLGGQAVMRSGFDSTSSMVFFACRQDGGGHTYANKNEVLYSALGRIWFPRVTTIASNQTVFDVVSTTQVSNAVLVNDLGVSPDTGTSWSSGVVPGKVVFFRKTDSIMTIAGDATKAYSYQWNNSGFGGLLYDNPLLNPPSVTKVTDGYNKYRFTQSYYSFDNIALYNRLNFTDVFTPPYYYSRTVERPYFNGKIKKVFRTVSMIQATNPYVIIADDVQKDNASSNYKWVTPIAPDLSVDATYANLSNNNYQFDVVLKEPSGTGNRRLLIRVLNANGAISSTIAGTIDSTTYTATGLRRFKIEANAIDPQFKVLLFPFQNGDALPVTTWSADKSKVYITNAGVTNTLSFSLDSAGRTNIGLNSADTGISWTGAIDTIWNKAGNWATGVIPTATDNVVIPSNGITNMPAITNAVAYANKISIQTGATLRVDSVLQLSGDMTLQGNIVGIGTIKTSSNSTSAFPAGQTWNVNIEYNKTTGGQTIVGGTYKGLSVNATSFVSTFTAAANLVVNGVLKIATGNILNLGTYIISGSMISATGTGTLQTQSTANPSLPSGVTWSGQVQLNSLNGPQYIPSGTYQNLNINTGSFGTITATGNVSVMDTLKLATKSTLDLGTNLLGGTLKIVSGNGTLRTANTTSTGALPPNATWAGNVVYYSSSTQTVAPGTYVSLDLSGGNNGARILGGSTYPTGTINLTGSLVATTGTITPNQTTVIFKGNQQTVPSMQFYNLDLTGGFATQFVNAAVYVSNVFTSASIIDAGGLGTLVFNGSSAQTVPSFGYNGLTLTNTRTGNITIPNTLTLTGNLSVAGLSFTSGSLSFSGNTINLSGTTAQTIDGNTAFPYNNINITNTTANVTSTTDLIINSALVINSGATLDIGSGQLSGSGISITNNGTIRTQNNTSTPLPSGFNLGSVKYNASTSLQYIVSGTYNNLDISGGTTGGRILSNGGTVTVSGNYTINSGSGSLTTTGSTIAFTGSAAQSISGATNFNNLIVNKTGTLNALSLGGATTVNGTLTLTQGRIISSSTNTLTVPATASISGGSASAYIDGTLTRGVTAGTVVYAFPLGNYTLSDNYLPTSLNYVSATGNITVATTASITGGSADGSTVSAISTNGYWRVASSVANNIGMAFTYSVIGSNNVIAQGSSSISPSGTYVSKGGLLSGSTITVSSLSLIASTNTYLVGGVSILAAPTISSVSSDVPGGTTFYPGSVVTINGANLSNTLNIILGNINVTATSNTGSVITLTVPSGGSNSSTLSVTTAGGTATTVGAYVSNGFISNQSGDWATASTWITNTVPTLGSFVVIKSPHVVALSTTINTSSTFKSPTNLTVNSGSTLNLGSGSSTGASSLTVTGTLTNNGTLNVGGDTYSGQLTVGGAFANTGNTSVGSTQQNVFAFLTLNGPSTNSGNISINYKSSSNSLNVGNTLSNSGVIYDSCNLQLTSASSAITGNGIIYATNSILYYNTGAVDTIGSEWLSGSTIGTPGVPKNVTIGNTTGNTVISFGNIATSRQLIGNLTISSATTGNGLVLSTASGGDLKVAGSSGISATQVASSAYNSVPGGLVCNGRMIYFNAASGSQTVTGPATGNPISLDYVTIGVNNTSTTTLNIGSDIAITAVNGGDPVTLTNLGTTNYINSNNSATSTRNITLGTSGQTCTGSVYIRPGGSNPSSLTINGNGSGTLNLNIDNGGGNSYMNSFTINNANVSLLKQISYVKSFNLSAGSLNVNGQNFTDSGTATIGSGSSTTTATFNIPSTSGSFKFVGAVNINTDGVWSNAGNNANVTFQGGISNSGTFTAGTGNYTFNANNQAIAGTISIPNVTVTSPFVLTNNGTLTVATSLTGNLTQGANSTLKLGGSYATATITSTATDNTVDFNGTGAQTIPVNSYYHLAISGNRSNNTSVTLSSGTINIAGNYNRSATFSGTGKLDAATNTLVFNGSVDQSITAASAETFNNLTINNTKSGGGVVTLGTSNFTLAGTTNALTLTNGKLSLGATNLTLNNTGVINSASATSYIITPSTGRLIRKAVSSATVFPVGTTTSYTPLTITNNTASDMTVRVSPTITNTVSDYSKIVNLQWSVASASATTSSSLLYQFNTADQAASFLAGNSCELGYYTTSYNVSTLGIPTSLGSGAYSLNKSALAFAAGTTYLSVLGNVNAISNNCTIGTYVGANGGDANAAGNWCGGVPSSSTNIIIASNTPKLTANLSVNNINNTSGISLNGFELTINGNLSGTGTITGSPTSSLTVKGTGTAYFDQTTNGTTNVLNNLIINSSGTVVLGNALQIAGTLTPTSGILSTGGFLTLKSDASNTARIAQGGSNYINGNVTVERYIPAKTSRKFSFLASPVTQSVFNGWQQQMYITGAGTGGQTCGTTLNNGGATDKYNSNWFDKTNGNAPSMFTYNATLVNGSRWVSIPNTQTTNLTPGAGFRVNVRGDRTQGTCNDQLNGINPVAPIAVTLKSTGAIGQGDIPITLNSISSTLLSLVGNPYPSQISFTSLWQNNQSNMYQNMWTLSPYGIGNYTSYSNGVTSNLPTGYSDALGNTHFIASGQAFFVQAKSAANGGTGTITFTEANKITGTIPNTQYFGGNTKLIRIAFNKKDSTKQDEVVVRFNNNGSINYDPNWDAASFSAGNQTLVSLKGNTRLAIATRPDSLRRDNVKLGVTSTTIDSFQLVFSDYQGIDSTQSITLIDKYVGQSLNIRTNQVYPFIVSADTASKGMNRFEVVLDKISSLNIKDILLTANKKDGFVAINWKLAQPNIGATYQIERSIDAVHFTAIQSIQSTGGNSYSWQDNQLPEASTFYYRILIKSATGEKTYSNIAQINNTNTKAVFHLYPNPVKDKLTIDINTIDNATYQLSISTLLGKEVLKKVGITNHQSILDVSKLVGGVYMATLRDNNGGKWMCKLVKE